MLEGLSGGLAVGSGQGDGWLDWVSKVGRNRGRIRLMSASSAAVILPFPRMPAPAGLDAAQLLRMTCHFHDLEQAAVDVLDDEDGDQVRFLCRAPRAAFRTREEFVAAAVKRYLGGLDDQGLAEMIYVAALYQAGLSERVALPNLHARLTRAFGGPLPRSWHEALDSSELWDAAVLNPSSSQIEIAARGARWWVYALVES